MKTFGFILMSILIVLSFILCYYDGKGWDLLFACLVVVNYLILVEASNETKEYQYQCEDTDDLRTEARIFQEAVKRYGYKKAKKWMTRKNSEGKSPVDLIKEGKL